MDTDLYMYEGSYIIPKYAMIWDTVYSEGEATSCINQVGLRPVGEFIPISIWVLQRNI